VRTLTLIETTMLAHDGLLGWDEALLVLGPLLLGGGSLVYLNRWAKRREAERVE